MNSIDFKTQISKTPRWCPTSESKPKDYSRCANIVSNKSTSETEKLPPIYSKDDLIGICEPPKLREKALHAVWNAKAHRKKVDDRLNEAVEHKNFLKQQLKQVKEVIEKLFRALEYHPGIQYLASDEEDEDYEDEDETSEASTHHNPAELYRRRHLEQELLKNVDEEERLTKELEIANRNLWEARLAENSLSLEIETPLAPALDAYDTRTEFMTQRRAFREKFIARNAEVRMIRTFEIAKKSMQEFTEAEIQREKNIRQRVVGAKTARKKIEHFLKNAMQMRKEAKKLALSNQESKQAKQHKMLSQLKIEIDKQRDLLFAQHEARQNQLELISEAKEQVREEFRKHGRNPYIVDHLLMIEERRAQLRRKILQQETERLLQLQKDYELEERAKKLEQWHKEKWDKFWKQKFAEKKAQMMQIEAERYNNDNTAVPPTDNKTKETATQVQVALTDANNNDTAKDTENNNNPPEPVKIDVTTNTPNPKQPRKSRSRNNNKKRESQTSVAASEKEANANKKAGVGNTVK